MVKNDTISKIIESNLLAPSPSRLAADLGYAGRTTINRLRSKTAGEEATEEFCNRIMDVIGLQVEDIKALGRMIELANEFAWQMQNECGVLSDSAKLKIVNSFIDDNYSFFSASYREMELNKWLLLKGHEKEMFFYMLALFFLRDKSKSFYHGKVETHERYKRVLESLQSQLKTRYPKHSIGNSISAGLLDTPLARLAYPCFLTAVRLGGVLLKGYVSDYSDAANHELIIKIPGLPDRSFWDENDNRNEVTFMKYVPVNNKGNGLYEYFKYNVQTGKTKNECQLYFYGEQQMGLFLKKERGLMFGHYYFDGASLKLQLKSNRDTEAVFTWTRLAPETSQRVKEIDRLFTESYLKNIMYESLGVEVSCGVMVSEVTVTKSKIFLRTAEGATYNISRMAYPWLKEVTPDLLPISYRDRSDNRIYIEWTQLGSRIALDEFTKK